MVLGLAFADDQFFFLSPGSPLLLPWSVETNTGLYMRAVMLAMTTQIDAKKGPHCIDEPIMPMPSCKTVH